MVVRSSLLATAALLALTARTSRADGTLLDDDTWNVSSCGCLMIDGGLAVGFPAALPTGLSKGIGAGITYGHALAAGARAAWTTATESNTVWTVTHSDLHLRATGAVQHDAGRGTLALRLGLGGTLVHEHRVRNQGMRAGLMGSDLESSAYAMLPAADLEAVVGLHMFGPWMLVLSGGPSVDVHDGAMHGSWNAQLGVGWQP